MPPPTILVCCIGNTCRSPAFAAIYNAEATARGVSSRAISAGLRASRTIAEWEASDHAAELRAYMVRALEEHPATRSFPVAAREAAAHRARSVLDLGEVNASCVVLLPRADEVASARAANGAIDDWCARQVRTQVAEVDDIGWYAWRDSATRDGSDPVVRASYLEQTGHLHAQVLMVLGAATSRASSRGRRRVR